MKDKIIRGITNNKFIRFFAVNSTETVREAVRLHNLSITNSVLLGRLLSGALLMGFDLKSESDMLTIKIEGDGPVGKALVTSNKNGEVKGYVNNPQLELPINQNTKTIDVPTAVGKGTLTIIRDLGLKNPYIGQVELKYGTIAQDLTYYFAVSEQIPSSVGLGVLIEPDGSVKQAGGFIVQLMPETPEEVISHLEQNLAKFPNLTDVMDMGFPIEKIIADFILKDFQPEILEEIEAKYKCDCSSEKFIKGLKLLSKEELQEALAKKEIFTVHCHLCNTDYNYGKDAIEKILKEMKS
ncbi:MAG TPA: Hsp33 family molecular chaperone HslO [Candidatus Cloacimonadota bacterium]|nr:Hsp33 family molecular chaperone HslO [Candidatus Cloacimonadota bacterium]